MSGKTQDIIFEPTNDPTIASLSIGSRPVLTVKENESVISTFRTMDQKKRSGIALVDQYVILSLWTFDQL